MWESVEIIEFGIVSVVKYIWVGCIVVELIVVFKVVVMIFFEINFFCFNFILVGDNFLFKMFFDEILVKFGDLIKFDCGVDVVGYGVDFVRIFVLGELDEFM